MFPSGKYTVKYIFLLAWKKRNRTRMHAVLSSTIFFNLNSLHTHTHAHTHARTRVFRFSNYSEMREFIQLESSSPCKLGLYHPMFAASKIIIIE